MNRLTFGQRAADAVVANIGSWRFIIIQSVILAVWITLNSIAWQYRWDIYPYVLCNLALSFQAAFASPLILMSSNRQSEIDRQHVAHIEALAEQIEALDEALDAHINGTALEHARELAAVKQLASEIHAMLMQQQRVA